MASDKISQAGGLRAVSLRVGSKVSLILFPSGSKYRGNYIRTPQKAFSSNGSFGFVSSCLTMEELIKDAICFGRIDEVEELLDNGVDPKFKRRERCADRCHCGASVFETRFDTRF